MLGCIAYWIRNICDPSGGKPKAQAQDDINSTFVEDLQRDGRLLLRVVVRRADRGVGIVQSADSIDKSPSAAAYSILTDEIKPANTEQVALLVAVVDDLSRRVAPATVSTIRLSSAYLKIPLEDGEPHPDGVAERARQIHCVMGFVQWLAIAVTIAAVAILAHADEGRRSIQQLQAAGLEVADYDKLLAMLPSDAWGPRSSPNSFAPFCSVETLRQQPSEAKAREGAPTAVTEGRPTPPTPSPGHGQRRAKRSTGSIPSPGQPQAQAQARIPSGTPAGHQAASLCDRRGQAALRMELLYIRLTGWNCRRYRTILSFGLIGGPWDECVVLPPPADAWKPEASAHWDRTETRTAGTISTMTGFILPLLMGCVGGCAYALRRLDQKLSEWALEFNDASHTMLRVLLATMLGGLLGVLWTGGEQVQLGGFTLSLAAAAFFVGFSIEIVFSVIETMVDGVAGKLRAPAPVSAAVNAMPPPRRPLPPQPSTTRDTSTPPRTDPTPA